MFVGFGVTLIAAQIFASYYGGDATGIFNGIAGFFLGVSEILYWVQRDLKIATQSANT
jgi:hypothetical protein